MPVVLTPSTDSTATPLITDVELLSAQPTLASLTSTARASLIAAATGAINRATDRILGQATYTTLEYPGRTRVIISTQYPIADVSRVACNLQPIVTVQYTGSSLRASVKYTSTGSPGNEAYTGLLLSVGGTTDATFSFTDYPTALALEVAINAVSGWSATILNGYDDWSTTDLLFGVGSKGAKTQPIALGGFIEELDYTIDNRRRTLKINRAFGDPFRYPDRSYGGAGLAWLGWSGGSTTPDYATVQAVLTAGYATENVPGDLKEIAYQAVKFFLLMLKNPGVYQSKSVGDESWALANLMYFMLPAYLIAGLAPYRRADIA